jgi:hypothetical protein
MRGEESEINKVLNDLNDEGVCNLQDFFLLGNIARLLEEVSCGMKHFLLSVR